MSNPYNLFLVPTDKLCHQEGAEGSMNPISSCGVKKKKQLAMAYATWSFSCTQYHRGWCPGPWRQSMVKSHDQISTLFLHKACVFFSRLVGSYIFFPSKVFIKPWFQRTRSLVKVPLSIKRHTSALCDSSYVYQHTGMVTFKHFLVGGPFQVTSSGNFGVINQSRHAN